MSNHSIFNPPKLAVRFFNWYCSDSRSEELLGDLEERYAYHRHNGRSALVAGLIFWWTVFRSIRSYAIEPADRINQHNNQWYAFLLQNLTRSLRHFKKQRFYASLNLLGLTVTYTVIFFLLVYVHFESNFESFHKHADQVYRVSLKVENEGSFQSHWARVDQDFVNELPSAITGIDRLVRLQNHEEKYVKIGKETFDEKHVYTTDPEIFELFSFDFIYGNATNALLAPNTVVLTETLAIKYFGKTDVLDQAIEIISEWSDVPVTHRVVGVVRDLPQNTHLPIELLISFKNEKERTWWAYTYVLINENVDIKEVQSAVNAFVESRQEENDATVSFVLQPVADIHLHSNLAREIVLNGSIQNIWIFTLTAFFILLIGVINFSNLFAAMVLSRTREVGLRKILGAERYQLIWSNLQEAITYSLVAMIGAVFFIVLLYDPFVAFSEVDLLINDKVLIGVGLAMAIVIGLLAGIYPSLVLTQFKPVQLLANRGLFSNQSPRSIFSVKNAMLTMQLSLAFFLLIAALIASDQFDYINRKSTTIGGDQIIAIPKVANAVAYNFDPFKEHILQLLGVEEVASCMEVPSREIRDTGPFQVFGLHETRDHAPNFDVQVIDEAFIDLMGLKLIHGQGLADYSTSRQIPEFTEDYTLIDYLAQAKRTYLINETAMQQLGWSDPAEATNYRGSWATGGFQLAEGPIIGVLADYHQETLKNKVDPTVYLYEPLWLKTFLIKVKVDNISQTLTALEDEWQANFPYYPMNYQFLDKMYEQLYNKETKQLALIKLASGLAIFLTLLGIVGLVAYSLNVRMKELAVRKVIGAGLVQLIQTMSKSFGAIILLAVLVASPICYLIMSLWLDNFAYHTMISPFAFLIAIFSLIGLLFSVISLQTMKAASTNPVDILKGD